MASSIAIPQSRTDNPVLQFARLIPGIALLGAIGYAGKLLEKNVGAYAKAHHWVFPNIEYVLWAILIGLAISNTVGVPAIFRAGVATYEFWLKAGIVLLGARFLLGDVAKHRLAFRKQCVRGFTQAITLARSSLIPRSWLHS